MILVLHNRYRSTGGEERAVDDLVWLLRGRLREDVEVLSRDSGKLGRPRAASAMLRGGTRPEEVSSAVRRTGARIVHAHNLNPSFGWRSLAAARAAGARTVLHLHNYRLVCAVGTCFTRGSDCTRCHGRNTSPGVRLRCRGSLSEAAVYGAGLSLWQGRLAAGVDLFVAPSRFAADRLKALGAPLDGRVAVVPHFVREIAERSSAHAGRHVLVVSRLAPEKGVDVAIAAAAQAGVPLVVAGDGPQRARLQARARGCDVRFVGAVDEPVLRRLRADAALAVVPSLSAETFGLVAAEAMAAGVPVVASSIGALPELLPQDALVEPGNVSALANAIRERYGDAEAGQTGLATVRNRASPERAASTLREAYASLGAW